MHGHVIAQIVRVASAGMLVWLSNATVLAQPIPTPMAFELQTTDPSCADCTTVFASGVIEPSTAEDLRKFITAFSVPHGALVDLDSPGGSLLGGIELGTAIRTAKLRTSVGMKQPAGDKVCASACAYAFLGGVERTVHPDARYGLHQFYGDLKGADAVAVSQSIVGELLNYTSSMGADADVIKLASVTASAEMSWVSAEERAKLRITTNDFVDGGVMWKTELGTMRGWQVQTTGQVVHFQFACPQTPISEREEAELLEKLSNWNVPAAWNAWSRDAEFNRRQRDFNSKKLGWGRDVRLDVRYFQAPDAALLVDCSLSTSKSKSCRANGRIFGGIPVEFELSLPNAKTGSYLHDLNGTLVIEENTARLRASLPRLAFEGLIDSSAGASAMGLTISPEVRFDGETVYLLSTDETSYLLPTHGFTESGEELLKYCERSRPSY